MASRTPAVISSNTQGQKGGGDCVCNLDEFVCSVGPRDLGSSESLYL